jgi:hypothetical protein
MILITSARREAASRLGSFRRQIMQRPSAPAASPWISQRRGIGLVSVFSVTFGTTYGVRTAKMVGQ